MQVHTRDVKVGQVDVGEYHAGAVAIYAGPVAIVTYSEQDCDQLIAAACAAKVRHARALNPALRDMVAGLALPDDAEYAHIADRGDRLMGRSTKLHRFTVTGTAIDPGVAREAALVLCDRAFDAEDARLLLEACGLIPYQRGKFVSYEFGRQR